MMHVQETRMQVVTGNLWWGTTMIEYLDRIGFLEAQHPIYSRDLAKSA